MKLAKNYQQPNYEDGPTAWLGEKPTKPHLKTCLQEKRLAELCGGHYTAIYVDIGSLKEPLDSTYRKQIILEQYGVWK